MVGSEQIKRSVSAKGARGYGSESMKNTKSSGWVYAENMKGQKTEAEGRRKIQ